jgi:hypothetical protein
MLKMSRKYFYHSRKFLIAVFNELILFGQMLSTHIEYLFNELFHSSYLRFIG